MGSSPNRKETSTRQSTTGSFSTKGKPDTSTEDQLPRRGTCHGAGPCDTDPNTTQKEVTTGEDRRPSRLPRGILPHGWPKPVEWSGHLIADCTGQFSGI